MLQVVLSKVKLIYFLLFSFIIFTLFSSSFCLPNNIVLNYVNGPQIWFYFAITLLLLLTGAYRIAFKRINNVKITPLDTIILVNAIYAYLASAILKKTILPDKILTICCLSSLYFIIKFYFSALPEKNRHFFFQITIISVLIILLISCLLVLLQIFNILSSENIYFKITGQFFNPAPLAIYLVALLPFCITAYLYQSIIYPRFPLIKFLSLVILTLTLATIFILQIRSAWISTIVLAIFYLFFKWGSLFFKIFKNKAFIFSALPLLFLLFIGFYLIKPASVNGRTFIWKVSYYMIKKTPLTGVGYGNFELYYNLHQSKYISEHTLTTQEIRNTDVIYYPYNIFIQILCEQGIIGLTLFLTLLYCTIPFAIFKTNTLFKSNHKRIYIFLCFTGISAIVLTGFFSYPFDVLPVQIILYIYIGVMGGLYSANRNLYIYAKQSNLINILVIIMLITGSFLLFNYTNNKLVTLKKWKSALTSTNVIANLTKLYPLLSDNEDFILQYSYLLSEDKQYCKVISVLNNNKAIVCHPSEFIELGESYLQTNDLLNAEKNLKVAYYMVPDKNLSKYYLMDFYYKTKKYKEVEKLGKTSYSNNEIRSLKEEVIKMKIKKLLKNAQDQMAAPIL